ncbi:MAG: hypothetical protein H6945_14305 [Zoogloeaceae bacterium]|nr:hypothetical protein [Rhodocyclaceae bacterium]MCP5236903.1 hypothetical protein [Zoogloeaceae bacterium]
MQLNALTTLPALARCVFVAAVLLAGNCAFAMKFESVARNNGQILLVRDCSESRESCESWEKSVHGAVSFRYPGDAAMLERYLQSGRFSEIWLDSGGGNLMEGMRIGRVLRRYKTFVRVPRGARCVSSCTVAFLGGVIRTVDAGATYEVHSYSAVLHGLKDHDRRLLIGDTENALRARAVDQDRSAREMVPELFSYAQEMLGGRALGNQLEATMRAKPDFLDRYLSDASSFGFRNHVDRIRAEGEAAAHDVAFRIERGAVFSALDALNSHLSQLGERADAAYRVLETMFRSDIRMTFELNDTTLREYGYVNFPPKL